MFGSGDTIELSCNTQSSSVSVFWFKDGIGIAPSNRTHIGQKLLKIINVSYDDSGLYSCKPRHSNEVLGNFTVRVTGTCRNRVDLLVFFVCVFLALHLFSAAGDLHVFVPSWSVCASPESPGSNHSEETKKNQSMLVC